MEGRPVNNLERTWKEAAVAYARYYPGIYLKAPRKIHEKS
jgi:hypothetical protein